MDDVLADQVVALIKQENKHNNHMLPKTSEQIKKEKSLCIIDENRKVIGYMGLMEAGVYGDVKIYERGSLIVDPKHRRNKIGTRLRNQLLSHHSEKPIYTVTNVERVKESNRRLANHIEYSSEDLPSWLYEMIEKQGPLLKGDVVFVNDALEALFSSDT